MLDLCKNTGLRICNGRLGEDCDKGDYIFHCRCGQSVVGHLLTPYNLLNLTFNLQIGPKHIDSDHGPVTFTLQIFSQTHAPPLGHQAKHASLIHFQSSQRGRQTSLSCPRSASHEAAAAFNIPSLRLS